MKKSNLLRNLYVNIFKLIVYVLSYFIFIKVFSRHYLGLRFFSRTLAVTTVNYFLVMVWMTSVYGRLDLGEKKSRPLFHTYALNLLITNGISFIVLRVMTVHDHFSFAHDVMSLILVYLIQLIIVRTLIYIGNSAYFIGFVPERTLIIHDNEDQTNKVLHYLNRHKKQYEIVDILHNPDIYDVSMADIENVFVISMAEPFLNNLLLKVFMLDCNIYYSSDISSVAFGNLESFVVDDLLLFKYQTQNITEVQKLIKRLIDIVFSLIGVVLLLPVMAVVALMIKLDDGGPIIFSHERLTKHGRSFKIYKFRSMKLNSGDNPVTKEDERITRVGHLIRKLRLDELPQLFNIIKGDMSIVGPRPESVPITHDIIKEVPEFGYRLKVQAGLTGTAQIFGKYNTPPKEKLLFDLYYIENFSIFNDIKLMFQTLIVFLKKDSTEGFENNSKKD